MNATRLNFDWIAPAPARVTIAEDIDFYRLFTFIRTRFDDCYFFESLALPRHQDRYHVIGFAPAAVFVAGSDSLRICGEAKTVAAITGLQTAETTLAGINPYDVLKNSFPQNLPALSHQGGLIGYFSHEAVNYFEPSLNLPEHPTFQSFRLGLYLDGLIFDTTTNTLEYYSLGADRGDMVRALLLSAERFTPATALTSVSFDGHSMTRDDYVRAVEATRQKIKEGYSFQSEVGFKSFFRIAGDKGAIYDKLRDVNPSPYMYYLKFGGLELMGASPEILVSNKNGICLTTPTAGTIRRGASTDEDTRLARALLNDPKEISEHNMLVDLHRNDLARVCRAGSVRVTDLMYIIRFSHVQHIVSNVVGELLKDRTGFDLLASILPGGVTTGAPKIETIKIIAGNESTPRGPYGGAVGRFAFNGDCDFVMPIRSLFCDGDDCFAQTSAGVVYDSDAEKEYEEVIHKLAAMKRVLEELGGDFDGK